MRTFEPEGPQALSRHGLAVWYGISDEQVSRLIDQAQVPVIRVGSQILVPIRALEAYEDELGRMTARRKE